MRPFAVIAATALWPLLAVVQLALASPAPLSSASLPAPPLLLFTAISPSATPNLSSCALSLRVLLPSLLFPPARWQPLAPLPAPNPLLTYAVPPPHLPYRHQALLSCPLPLCVHPLLGHFFHVGQGRAVDFFVFSDAGGRCEDPRTPRRIDRFCQLGEGRESEEDDPPPPLHCNATAAPARLKGGPVIEASGINKEWGEKTRERRRRARGWLWSLALLCAPQIVALLAAIVRWTRKIDAGW